MARHPASAVIASFTQIARPIMRQFMGSASCIGAARTTVEVMRAYGLHAVEIPVCFVFQVPARNYARIIGLPAKQLEEVKAKSASWEHVAPDDPGWDGHLVVLVEDRWLLDSAIDQVDAPRFGVFVPAEVFVVDTAGQDWNPNENFEIQLGLILDNGDHATLIYRCIEDYSYLKTEAWQDEGLPLLAHAIAIDMERNLLEAQPQMQGMMVQ